VAKPAAVPFGCPAAPLHAGSSWSAARQQLAPRGAVAIRLGRYTGVNAKPPLNLVASGVVAQRQKVDVLVRRFDSLKPLSGAVACPADDGSRIVALLGYTRHEPTISMGLTGCSTVTNGRVSGRRRISLDATRRAHAWLPN
jgi:hypothetical protein